MKWEQEYKTKYIKVLDTQIKIEPNGKCEFSTNSTTSYSTTIMDISACDYAINQLRDIIALIQTAPNR